MSTETPPSESDRPDRSGPREPDAEEMLARLRSAPADEVAAELFSTLITTAQVKLGRRDARLFIDLCQHTLDHARSYLSEELSKQVEAALGQLRLAQVSAESEVAKSGQSEPNDLSRIPTPPAGHGAGAEAGSQPEPPTSKLWVPGR